MRRLTASRKRTGNARNLHYRYTVRASHSTMTKQAIRLSALFGLGALLAGIPSIALVMACTRNSGDPGVLLFFAVLCALLYAGAVARAVWMSLDEAFGHLVEEITSTAEITGMLRATFAAIHAVAVVLGLLAAATTHISGFGMLGPALVWAIFAAVPFGLNYVPYFLGRTLRERVVASYTQRPAVLSSVPAAVPTRSPAVTTAENPSEPSRRRRRD